MRSVSSILNNRYRLDKLIGEGGFAQVFLATDLELARKVALKVLDDNWVSDKALLTRFRNEARAIAALDHPHILQIYDFGLDNGTPFIVMPYVSGGTLANRMKQERLTFDEIGVYLEQVSSALDYAHQQGIVHRDVKPSNLLIHSNGQLVLMDFGLAKLLANVSLAVQSTLLGTIAYMAPEQCRGYVSAASDIYMLGVILYQMLAGKLPYAGDTVQVANGHLHLAPKSLGDQLAMRPVSPVVVQALDQVILKVLAKSPADRYQTCRALCYAYRKALASEPGKAARYSNSASNPAKGPLSQTLLSGEKRVIPPVTSNHKKILLKPPRLLVTTEPDRGFRATFDLTGEKLTLGRAKDNNICLPLSIVSRYHAVLSQLNGELEESSYKIIHRQSINSLRFKGEKVPEKVLFHGDTIEIGERGYAEYIVKLTYLAPEYSSGP